SRTPHAPEKRAPMTTDEAKRTTAIYERACDDLERSLADAPALLTIDEIAELTGYSRRTVSKWVNSRKFTFTRPDPSPKGHVRVPKAALIDYLALRAG